VTHSFKGRYTETSAVVGSRPRVAYSVSDASFAALVEDGCEGSVGARVIGAIVCIFVFGLSFLISISDLRNRGRAGGTPDGSESAP
jgi:hypothetical protein